MKNLNLEDQIIIMKIGDNDKSKYVGDLHPNIKIGNIYTGKLICPPKEGRHVVVDLYTKVFNSSTVKEIISDKVFKTKNSKYFISKRVINPTKGRQIINKEGKTGVIKNIVTCDITGIPAIYVDYNGEKLPRISDITTLYELTE